VQNISELTIANQPLFIAGHLPLVAGYLLLTTRHSSLATGHVSLITHHWILCRTAKPGLTHRSKDLGLRGGFSNRLACSVKRLFSLSLKTAEQSHIMPHSARNIAQQLNADKFN
jgi:hypothetical protein